MPTTKRVIYECGICDCYHRWGFAGDCRQDSERYGSPEEYAKAAHVSIYKIEVRSMDERVNADRGN